MEGSEGWLIWEESGDLAWASLGMFLGVAPQHGISKLSYKQSNQKRTGAVKKLLLHGVQQYPADHSKPHSGYPAKSGGHKEPINLEPRVQSNYYKQYLLSTTILAEEE